MSKSTILELSELQIDLERVDTQINEHRLRLANLGQATDSMDEFVIYENICALETERDKLELRVNKLMELREYQLMCEHEFIQDLIDIDPDKSELIVFCKHCLYEK